MRPIQMVDLKQQYNAISSEVNTAISDVLNSCIFIGGPHVNSFSENLASYLGAKHVIPCANGTDALQIAMMALGLQPGDEVITPSFTYVATTEVIALLKLKPVFVEVDTKTFCTSITTASQVFTWEKGSTTNGADTPGFFGGTIFKSIIASNCLCVIFYYI
jgi:dTDP-4-amino-4,6-dideoxygalactose transaminase